MTNQEKATELISGMTDRWGSLMAFHKLTQMAEWKDAQFKEYLENQVKAYKCRGKEFFKAEIKAIEKIIDEL